MHMRNFILAVLVVLSGLAASAQRTLIYCGQLIDPKAGKSYTTKTIVVEGSKISDILDGYSIAGANDKVIDLKNRAVMPGLIDMHVHLELELKKGSSVYDFMSNPSDIAFSSIKFAGTTLLNGFTTVRDLGGTGVNISLRNAIAKGEVTGPRIFTAGKSIATTGGHADPTNGYRKDLMGDPGQKMALSMDPMTPIKQSVSDIRKGLT